MANPIKAFVAAHAARQPAPQDPNLVQKIAGTVLSPISAAANILDLPGSSVRDLVAGQNPLDQYGTAWWKDAGNRTSGRDLLRRQGLAGPQDSWGNWGAGFATEIALDPTTYLTGGLSGVGKALQGTGKASHLFKATVPFTKIEKPFGQGAAKLLDKAASRVWNAQVGGVKPLQEAAIAAKGLFDYKAGGHFHPLQQQISKNAVDALEGSLPAFRERAGESLAAMTPVQQRAFQELQQLSGVPASGMARFYHGGVAGDGPRWLTPHLDYAKGYAEKSGGGVHYVDIPENSPLLQKAFDDTGTSTKAPFVNFEAPADIAKWLRPIESLTGRSTAELQDTFNRILQHALETSPGGTHKQAFEQAFQRYGGGAASPELASLAEGPLKRWADDYDWLLQEKRSRGVPIDRLEHPSISYSARAAHPEYLKAAEKNATREGLFTDPSSMPREKLFRNLPQGIIREILQDPQKFTKERILEDFGQHLGYSYKSKQAKVVDEATGKIVRKQISIPPELHAEKLAKWANGLSAKGVKDIHLNNPAGLFERSLNSGARILANADAAHEAFRGAVSPRGVPLTHAYKSIGLRPAEAVEWMAKQLGLKDIEKKITKGPNKGQVKVITAAQQAAKLRIDPATVDAISKMKQAWKAPAWLDLLGKGVDKFNQVFKASVTLPFPSFHMRNFLSGQHMNLASKHLRNPQDYAEYAKAFGEAWRLHGKGDADPAMRELMSHGVYDPYRAYEDVELPSTNPQLANPFNPLDAYRQSGEYVAKTPASNPLTKRLNQKTRQALHAPLQSGANMARSTEFMNRVPMYLYLKKKGLSPAEAAAEVGKLQFKYENATKFEKGVLKRLIPFYSFTKNVVPQIAGMLADQPGGKMAQTLRAIASGKGDTDFLPANVADTAAVPLGEQPDGTKRYLTGFGLAPEAALPYLTAPLDTKGAFDNFMSGLTPVVKGPLEWGQQYSYFGRKPLDEMDPNVGRTLSNLLGRKEPLGQGNELARLGEHVLSNTPATKLLNIARTASDPRKSALVKANNILTPFRVTDVSPQQQEKLLMDASREMAKALGAREWKESYFSKERLAEVAKSDPALAAQMQQLKALWSSAKKKARQKAKDTKTP